jgi:aryl-alcohol dehydrogenase-like predicted oxidoreductase
MTIDGRATSDGTERYTERFPEKLESDFYRSQDNQRLSTIGLGTYLGDATDKVDDDYRESIETALTSGINFIDSAINYRFQRSERVIGSVLESLVEKEEISRDEIVVATKGGFVPFDSTEPDDPLDYIKETFVEPGIASPDDFTQNGHCMSPDYLEHQLHRSLDNLNLETIDIFYVHNPEMQLSHSDPDTVYSLLEKAFNRLESMVEAGKIGAYGIATWDGLRVDPQEANYLSLEEVHARAESAGGEDHHFRAVQLPFNLGMSEALTKANQPLNDEPLTPLEVSNRLDLLVATSASILQGRLANDLPEEIREDLQEYDSDVVRSLQFARSAPGVTTALVGMSSSQHVLDNLDLANYKPFTEDTFRKRFLEEVR